MGFSRLLILIVIRISILVILATVGDGHVERAHPIGTLPAAARNREAVAMLVVHAVVAIRFRNHSPLLGDGLVEIHLLSVDAQIHHRLIARIEVDLDALAIAQVVAQLHHVGNAVRLCGQLFTRSALVDILRLVIHHHRLRGVGRSENQVVAGGLAIVDAGQTRLLLDLSLQLRLIRRKRILIFIPIIACFIGVPHRVPSVGGREVKVVGFRVAEDQQVIMQLLKVLV